MIRQMIKVMARALPVCVLAMNACDSGSQDLEGMLKSMQDACVEKDGYFQADADYQCTCNGMPLGNMEVCMNQTMPMNCDPEAVVKECVKTFNETSHSVISQWRYCRYGFWEYGELSEGEKCELCDSSFKSRCEKKDDGTFVVKSCVGGVLESKPCENGCVEDDSSCTDCKNGVNKCDDEDDTILLMCEDGAYKSKKCQGKCEDGKCAPVCKEEEKRCDNDNKYLRVCNEIGEWENKPCGFGCANNECVIPEGWDGPCAGEYMCEDIIGLGIGYKVMCEGGKKTLTFEPCYKNSILVPCASESLCGECLNGDEKCENGVHKRCEGSLWKTVENSDECVTDEM